jgi:SAM-dependent methyltransferase
LRKDSVQKGWKWLELKDKSNWEKPDGPVISLVFSLGQNPELKVYDLGCGIGRHTVFFAEQGYQVYASDISHEAVEETKNWLKRAGLSATVNQGQMTAIDQPTHTFDLVVSFNVIYHSFRKDIVKTISEVFRILKPGGIFYGTLLTKDKGSQFTENENQVIDEQTLIIKGGVEDGVPHFFSHLEDVFEFFTEFEIEDLVYAEVYDTPYNLENLLSQKGWGHYRFLVKKPSGH